MASRFPILDSLGSSLAPSTPASWRERPRGAQVGTYDLVPHSETPIESIPSSNGAPLLVPFSLESIESPRPGSGKLVQPMIMPTGHKPPTSSLRAATSYGGDQEVRHTGYLTGISLSGILQMLHLERNSCVLEVTAAGRLGTLTLVNGELIDAEIDDQSGDAVALQILRWHKPVTAILPSEALVRHSVNLPLTQLLIDSVRLQDESIVAYETQWLDGGPEPRDDDAFPSAWRELPSRLVSLGAHVALVMTPANETPIAEAGQSLEGSSSSAAVARGVRTWSSLLVDGVDRVHVIAGARRLVMAALGPDDHAFVYVEVPADMPLGAIWQAIADVS